MTPSQFIQNQVATLLAADVGSLAGATAPKLHLAKAPFTPSRTLDPTTLVESDFDGYAALAIVAGPQESFLDPVSGLLTVELKAPAAGWHFLTTGVTKLPQNVYGFYVTDSTGAQLFGSALLPTPISLTLQNEGFDVEDVWFQFLNNSPQ